MTLEPLLTLIRRAESEGAARPQGVPSAYDVVWGGIKPADRPQARVGKRLTQMTVAEVLAWQESIDDRYRSEAAGAYQIMEDTFRGLRSSPAALFNHAMQDALATQLLKRRRLDRWVASEITDAEFGDRIAMEWASFPVMSPFLVRADGRTVTRGQSYYAGDGLNAAHVKPGEVEAALGAVRASMAPAEPPPVAPPPEAPPAPWWRWLLDAIFGGSR
jgi:hypothetical protein